MSHRILDLFPHQDIIFPQQQADLVIPQSSPFFRTKLQGSIIGICFLKTTSTNNLTSVPNIHEICMSFKVQNERIQTNGPHPENDFKIVTGTALDRLRIIRFLSSTVPYQAEVQVLDDHSANQNKNIIIDSSIYNLREMASDYLEVVRQRDIIKRPEQELPINCSVSSLCYIIASQLKVPNEVKYDILKLQNDQDRVENLTQIIKTESVGQQTKDQARRHAFEAARREMRQKNLHGELNNIKNEFAQDDELDKIRDRLQKTKLPKEVLDITTQEFNRLKQMSQRDPEYGVQKKYLEIIADLPWDKASQESNDITYAEMVLDKDHAGLQKVKTRILEFIAVKILKKDSKGSILCLQGPPGVGKTSLGKSIAEALGRKFERIALGGVSDEAEVRGHRRTYLGAMPGMMIDALLRCKTNNPVVLLDEIDKVARNKRSGDPSSALLEVLDPNQNNSFKDHYLGVPFDLSNILFIATANTLDTIAAPLLDRMEVITLSGYTPEEKTEIAKHYLVPKQIQENGIQRSHIEFPDSSIRFLVDCYTREAGVRNLERTVGSLCRKVALQYLKNQQVEVNPQMDAVVVQDNNNFEKVIMTEEFIEQELGPRPFDDNIKQDIHEPGIAFGMAWTAEGGKILTVETSLSRGQGRLQLTGQLGDVMKESVLTSLGWIKSNYSLISFLSRDSTSRQTILLDQEDKICLDHQDLNVHFPAAAIPKDGPSAGITITIALISILTKRKVMNDVAMTGEVSLKGAVLPVGGIKEKCLAAYANGLKRVILPDRNKKDILDLPKEVRDNMTFHFVKNVIEAIVLAIEPPVQNESTEGSLDRIHKPKL